MALVTVQLNTDVPEEKAALTQLFGGGFVAAVQKTTAPVTVPSEAPAPAPKAAAKPKPQPKVETPPPAPEEPAEDLLGDGPDYAALRKAAVDAATVLVSSEGPARLKEALTGIGAKRVSEVPDEKLEAFIAAIA